MKRRQKYADHTSKGISCHVLIDLVSLKVIKGHQRSKITEEGQKGQHLIFRISVQIIRQNEALDVKFSIGV